MAADGARHGLRGSRNVPFTLFLLCVLGYGAATTWFMLAQMDLVDLLRNASREDAFYYFQIAYNMAEGRFSTFDGLTRTNGYHPLWLFLITPFYWAFDKIDALFAIKAFEIMLLAGGVALIAGAAKTARQPWILLFAVLPELVRTRHLVVGVEAAASVFVLGSMLLAVCLFVREPRRWRWLLAGVVFALPWTRLEYVAVALAVSAGLFFLEWRAASSARSQRTCEGCAIEGVAGRWPPHATVPLLGAIGGILVYFIYNGMVFGGILPVSGVIKAAWSQWHWQNAYDLTWNIRALLHSFHAAPFIAIEVSVYALVVWWLCRRPPRTQASREDRLLLAFMVGVFGLAACHLAQFAHAAFFMHPLMTAKRHFVPANLMEALILPIRCYVAIFLIRRFLGPRLPHTSDLLRLAVIVAAGMVIFFVAPPAAQANWIHGRPEWGSVMLQSYMGTLLMNRLLPKGTVVGAWDSGVMGYFSHSPVMNLDGVVNSYDYHEARKDGTRGAFRRSHGVSHLANWFVLGVPTRTNNHWDEDFRELASTHGVEITVQGVRPPLHGRIWSPFNPNQLERPTSANHLGFDLRVMDDHLVYAKAPCRADDFAHSFYLHVLPMSLGDLSEDRLPFGYDHLEFRFADHGDLLDGVCLAHVPLPDYGIAAIRTGQLDPRTNLLFASPHSRERQPALQFRLFRDDPDWAWSNVDRSSWFWETMAPHLERQADGVGLLKEGRVALAFAPACPNDEVALWTFGSERTHTPWTRDTDGICMSYIVLPRGDYPPVQVRSARV